MKVMCTKCGKVLDVSRTDEVCFCNECGNNFPQAEGLKLINKQYKYYQDKAYKDTYSNMDYESAIQAYKDALEIRPNDFSSIVGLILCTLYAQSFDHPKFNEIENIINSFDISLDNENTFIYLNFIKDVLQQVKVFYNEANARLCKDGAFINEKYEEYFKKGLQDALNALNFLKSNIELCYEEELKDFTSQDDVLIRLDEEIIILEEDVNKNYRHTDTPEELEDLSVIVVDHTAKKKMNIFYGLLGSSLVLLIILIIIASTTKNNYVYIGLIAPFLLAGGTLVYFKKYFKNLLK